MKAPPHGNRTHIYFTTRRWPPPRCSWTTTARRAQLFDGDDNDNDSGQWRLLLRRQTLTTRIGDRTKLQTLPYSYGLVIEWVMYAQRRRTRRCSLITILQYTSLLLLLLISLSLLLFVADIIGEREDYDDGGVVSHATALGHGRDFPTM